MTHQGIFVTHWLALCLGGWIAMCSAGPCDHGWYYRNGTCYHFHSEKKSWNDANDTCTGLNASLVQIKYLELNTYLTVTAATIFTAGHYWLGLRRPDVEYRNYNENTATILKWRPGEPNDGLNACVFAQNSEMIDNSCNIGTAPPDGFICQASKGCNDTTLNTGGFAAKRHQYGSNTCLMHSRFSTSYHTWNHCKSSCSKRPGHLVHMTPDIDSFLRGRISDYSKTSFWIAARPYQENSFYWMDGTLNEMNMTWVDGQMDHLLQNCVKVHVLGGGLWRDSSCTKLHHVICEKEAYPFEPPSITTSLTKRQKFDCRCRCARLGKNMIVNMTMEQLQHAVNKLKSELAVNKSSLSSVIRRKISAGDQRQSATIVGYIGTAILCVVFGSIIIADLPKLLRILQHPFKTKRRVWGRHQTHPRC